jgi:L-fuconolactonase
VISGPNAPGGPNPDVLAVRIDAHHHFWDLESGLYPWLTTAEPAIRRTFSPAELEPELMAAGIDATVLVQAADSLADTDAMLDAASRHSWIAGVVGWLPLADLNAAERALDARSARSGRLCGVRHLIHWDADPLWLTRPDVQPGLRLLAKAGLPFDVVAVFPGHLPLVPAVAAAHPDLVMVIDHLAKPPFRSPGWDRWVTDIARAAGCPTVYAKISGLDTAAGPGWTVDELRPAWDIALERFGPSRLMFGSDWPVCRLVSSYGEVVSGTLELIAELSPTERDRVLGGTAIDVYDLSLPMAPHPTNPT